MPLKSRSRNESYSVEGNALTFIVRELNDYMKLLDREPARYTITYFFDDEQRIEGTLIAGLPDDDGAEVRPDRLDEFLAWAEADHAQEMKILMPEGRIVPSRDNARRFRELLNEWRASMTAASVQR